MTTNAVREKFDQFRTSMGELVALKGIEELLGWDQQVMMPEKSGDARGLQMQAISGVLHDKATSKELGNLLTELESFGPAKLKQELSEWERAAIRDARRNYDKEVKLPKELVQKAAKLNVEGFNAWVAAKKNNDFQKFAPILKEWVSLKKETAKALNPTLPAYDVLLDNFERGLSTKTIDNLFTQIKEALIPLIEKIKSKPEPDSSFLEKNFDVEAQAKFNHQLAKDLGFDTNSGRLDVSAHPFTCGIHSTDVRMTTRYKENDIMEGITGTIHETGHSLYEQGRTKDPLPVSEALSMGIHESQSLLWERMVGLSLPFWEYLTPKLKESFPQIPKEVTAEQVYRAFNKSKPGLIRIESDEVTYPMHIILRYEIERDLIEGGLDVNDLPKVWNEKMKKYLGIEPPTDSVGVLQDVHWSGGAFGYFPTYTLGAIYASQFFAQAEREISGLNDHLRKGNFAILKEWLNKKVHEKGSLIPSGELLMKEVTGEPLNPQVFINYLKQKYTKLYNL